MAGSSETLTPTRVWTFGSDASCDVVIREAAIAPRHCLLARYERGYAIEDLGSQTGTWLNGEALTPQQPRWVDAQDQILLAGSVVMPWPEVGNTPNAAGSNETASNLLMRKRPAAERSQRTITIGRSPENTVVLDYPMISWNHARLVAKSDGHLVLEDLDSTNGTAVGHPENKIRQADISAGDSVFFGSFKLRASRLLEDKSIRLGNATEETVAFKGNEMVIGRDPDCDYPLNFPMVSWRHAKLTRTSAGTEIEDLGSRNGTFVNGVRIESRITLKTGSEIGLGSFRFRLLENGNLAKRDYRGNVTIEAAGVVVEIGSGGTRRRLLDPISLTVFPSELVALMGPAGAGKTTLLKAINGYTPPALGQVLFNGEDLYANHEQFRLQVGYVPQDDILHAQLTVREALYYTAKLRTELRDAEIDARVMQVLSDLNIEDIADRLIGSPERKVISGGQRKRVNIAMELLSEPSVLFLDEPTSGLSSYDAAHVMGVLRRIADAGKTVLCTIHQPSVDIFREFDSLIMVARDKGDNAGMLVYFGPAYPESIHFFNPPGAENKGQKSIAPPSPEMLMSGLAARKVGDWVSAYQKSTQRREFVEKRAGQVVSTQSPHVNKRKREFGVKQLMTLARRNLLLKLRDKTQMLILLAQAPLFAALLTIVFRDLKDHSFGNPTEWAQFSGKIASVHFLMVVAAVWFGCNNAARDIVGETAIFQRERMVNLRLPSYVLSKMTVLMLISLFQCAVLLAVVYFGSGLTGPFWLLLSVLFVASAVGASLGLLISALSPTTEAAIAFLPVVLLPFILLGGGIKPLHEMPQAARWIAGVTPTRWAYEANLLAEGKTRHASFTNEVAQKLAQCQATMAQCDTALRSPSRTAPRVKEASVETQTDIADAAFPIGDGRSSLRRSMEVLGVFLGGLLILVLSTLQFKRSQ